MAKLTDKDFIPSVASNDLVHVVDVSDTTSDPAGTSYKATITQLLAGVPASTWGSITGTLSDQTDLQSALDGKVESVVAGTNVTVDNTDPLNPIVSATGGGSGHDPVTVTDSTEIDFTLTGQDITASLKAGSIDETKLDASTNASLDLADSALQNVVDDTTPQLGGDLDALDNAINNVEVLNFNTTPVEPTYTEGNVYWDATDKTLIVEQGVDNVRLQVGQENYIRVRNSTGSTITDGQVVYISGVTGNRPNITLARADVAATAEEIGIATHDIENNTDGLVTVNGAVRGLDTSSFSVNDTVYLSAVTAGALTNTAPASPNLVIPLGKVLTSNPATGEILVSTLPFKAGVTSIDSLRVHQNAEVIGLTASRALTTNSSKVLTSSATTATELGYVSGVTSAIQTQLDNKITKSSTHYLVAANDATAKEKANADYQCDGVADDVQINTALDLIRATGGKVVLSSGTFAIAASINMLGNVAESDSNPFMQLLGAGSEATTLTGATNINIIATGQRAKYEIAYFTAIASGSGDCISQTAGTERGNWQSWIHDVFLQGNFTDHTGWGLDLQSPFRMRLSNIEMNGVANGCNFVAHTNAFNPGNLTVDRMFIDLWDNASNASAIGFQLKVNSTTSTNVMNLVSVNRLDIYGGTNLTSSIGISIVGASASFGDSRHHSFNNMNIEDVQTVIKHVRGRDCTYTDLNYCRPLSGGTFIDLDGTSHNNFFENAYVTAQGSGQTFNLIVDSNGSSNLPNSLKRVDGFQPATVTINATLASNTILEQIDLSGGTPTIDADITNRNNTRTFQNVLVDDEVYGVGWNASLEVPTKNAIYDKIETLGGGGLAAVVDDTTPQLGGGLDVNGNAITSATNGNIQISPNGTGQVLVNATTPVSGGKDLTVVGDGFAVFDATTPTKGFRARFGGATDFEFAGADAFFSIWSGGDFTGTQTNVMKFTSAGELEIQNDTTFSDNQVKRLSYLGFNDTYGAAGIGLRVNAGVMESKNSAGAWVPLVGTTSTDTLTNKDLTASTNTYVNVVSEASSATPTATGDRQRNDYVATALVVNTVLAAPSGTANANAVIRYRITASGGTRTVGYNAALLAGGVTRTTSLAAGETLTQIYERIGSTWVCQFDSVTS